MPGELRSLPGVAFSSSTLLPTTPVNWSPTCLRAREPVRFSDRGFFLAISRLLSTTRSCMYIDEMLFIYYS